MIADEPQTLPYLPQKPAGIFEHWCTHPGCALGLLRLFDRARGAPLVLRRASRVRRGRPDATGQRLTEGARRVQSLQHHHRPAGDPRPDARDDEPRRQSRAAGCLSGLSSPDRAARHGWRARVGSRALGNAVVEEGDLRCDREAGREDAGEARPSTTTSSGACSRWSRIAARPTFATCRTGDRCRASRAAASCPRHHSPNTARCADRMANCRCTGSPSTR